MCVCQDSGWPAGLESVCVYTFFSLALLYITAEEDMVGCVYEGEEKREGVIWPVHLHVPMSRTTIFLCHFPFLNFFSPWARQPSPVTFLLLLFFFSCSAFCSSRNVQLLERNSVER